MTSISGRGPWRRRRAGASLWNDDEGTIAMLLMVVLVGLSLSALIVPMIISQNRTSRFDISRVQSLDGAQAGVDVALGLIRGAVSLDATGVSYGDSTRLPCGPLSGTVTGNTAATYSVTIEYFTFDPVQEPTASSKAMNCVAGYGIYDPTTKVYAPSFARITSKGTVGPAANGSSGGRTLVTTYVFKTTNTNIPGGSIQIDGSTPALCMDVGSATAIAGATVSLQTCSNSASPIAQQSFAYRTDLTLQLLSSVTTGSPNGLCVTPSTAPPAANNGIALSACNALGSPAYAQQWSYNDSGKYQASSPTSQSDGGLPDLCLTASAQSVGVPLTLGSCGAAVGWIPAASVGPGGAALPQWINYSEFGRCLDVTNQDVNTSHLIDFPCKQNPYPNAVTWNQKFVAPPIPTGLTNAVGQIYTTVTSGSTKYCLTSPGTNGGYVTVGVTCGATGTPQSWTIYGGDKTLSYASKYTIVDSAGLCLGLTTPVGGERWSAIDVETCTGSTEQKWNASANVLNPTLQNTREK